MLNNLKIMKLTKEKNNVCFIPQVNIYNGM